MKKRIKALVLWFYGWGCKILPIHKKTIVFGSNLGRNYSGNPRAIYEEMVRRGLDKTYHLVWVFDHPDHMEIPGKGKKVKTFRLRHFYTMCTAGVWIFDCRQNRYFIKREGVRYLQTWHGTPLKKLGLDMEGVSMSGESDLARYKENFQKDSSRWDALLSQNPFSSGIFPRAFGFGGEMLEVGYPRNDVLFSGNRKETIGALKQKFGIPQKKKVILYAPTWRDNVYHEDGRYKFTSGMDFDRMKQALEEDWVMIVKYHYLVADQVDWSGYEGFIYSFDNSYDIAELYLVSDLLVTDYSSVMFDYSLLHRPMVFYTYDLEEYRDHLRGFYFDFLKEAPGPITQTTEELIGAIQAAPDSNYREKEEAFSKKYNPWDDGNGAGHVVDWLEGRVCS